MYTKASEIRIRNWVDMIQAANDSQLTKTEWCRQQGITKQTFYYWKHKVQEYLAQTGANSPFEEASDNAGPTEKGARPVFCEISLSETEPETASCLSNHLAAEFEADAVIQCGAVSVMINKSTSAETLKRLFSVLRSSI